MEASGWMTLFTIAVPWLAAIVVALARRHERAIAFAAALVSLSASLYLLHAASDGSLGEALMVLFSCLFLTATCVLPKRDCTPGTIAGILFVFGSTLLAYSSR